MRFSPRNYQIRATNTAYKWLLAASRGQRLMIAGPTGSGKSIVHLMLLDKLPRAWCIVPRMEIIAGMLDKLGYDITDWSEARVRGTGEAHRMFTPLTLRNRLMAGTMADWPDQLLWDEGHHWEANSWTEVDVLCGSPPSIALTATPFRGTPKGTAELRKHWGEPVWMLTMREAVASNVIAFPSARTVPLLDDDLVEVRNGEFVVSAIESAAASRLEDAAELVHPWYNGVAYDRATTACLPSRELARLYASLLADRGLPARVVDGDTSWADRQAAFAATVRAECVLVQVRVVGEGVDLPLRRLLDLSPCMSPVRWLQLFGRITRPTKPGEAPPEYVCANRNLLRHAYLLEGLMPPSAIAEAQAAFKGPGKRAAVRSIGLELLGRFKAAELPLANGTVALMYNIASKSGEEFAAITAPYNEEVLWAMRVNAGSGDSKRWGTWRRCAPPEGLEGFQSAPASPMSEKQAAWWARDAGKCGLNAAAAPTRKAFAALPILLNTKWQGLI